MQTGLSTRWAPALLRTAQDKPSCSITVRLQSLSSFQLDKKSESSSCVYRMFLDVFLNEGNLYRPTASGSRNPHTLLQPPTSASAYPATPSDASKPFVQRVVYNSDGSFAWVWEWCVSNRNIDRGLIECASSSDGKTKSSKAYSLAKQEPVKVRSTIGIATQKIESSTVVC